MKVRLRELANGWKGGKTYKEGRIYIYQPGHPYATVTGYVAEHRLVMEKKISRYLLPTEVVHHKNDIYDDNREENLTLFPTTGKHTVLHNKKRVYTKGYKLQSKYRKEYGKTLKEMSEELGITPQGVRYRLRKRRITCAS